MEIQTQQFVTKEMTIGDVVGKYPYLSEVMLNYGLHCVGCHVNPYESIENGCLGQGMDEGTINKLIDELNKTVLEHGQEKEFSISNQAVEKLKFFMKQDNKENYSLRLNVNSDGCCGDAEYGLDFAEKSSDNEIVFNDNGINVFIDKVAASKLNGLKIDYIENEKGAGFKIESGLDNKKSGCGCH